MKGDEIRGWVGRRVVPGGGGGIRGAKGWLQKIQRGLLGAKDKEQRRCKGLRGRGLKCDSLTTPW